MNVLLVSANLFKEPEPVFPLGCAYLIAALKREGHEVSFLDLLFHGGAAEALKKKAAGLRPGLVALSVRNIENLDFPSNRSLVPELRSIIHEIKSATEAPLAVGGGGFSVAPKSFLSTVGGDVGIAGEGEEVLPRLASDIEKNGSLPDNLKQSIIEAPPLGDLEAVLPDRDDAGQASYLPVTGCATVQTKRGCNLTCSYCTYPSIEGKKIRTREAERVVEEIDRVARDHAVTDFTFVDSIFNNPESHAMAFCEAVLRKGLKITWTAYFKPSFHDPSFFSLLARAGCSGIDATPDSLSETTLSSLGKDLSPGEVEVFCEEARKEGLAVNLNFIFGAPGEDERTLEETFRRIETCSPTSIIACMGVRLYPGAPMTASLLSQGAVAATEIGVEPVFYVSEKIADTLVDKLSQRAGPGKGWIIPGLGIRYNPRLFKRMRKHGKKGPIWKFT
jgi:radical SAM superfamily enzyme YgiQ (UPF0313 family)